MLRNHVEEEMMADTAKIAEAFSGDKLYQQRARKALPLLVGQAQAQSEINYSQLAAKLGMPNPRNLNYPLGSIGVALEALSEEWDEKIPPIQCLVVNQRYGLPGEGIGWFITKKADFRKLSRSQQRALVRAELQRVYEYTKWPVVLKALGLSADYTNILSQAKRVKRVRGGGESEDHRILKEYIVDHPAVLQLPATIEKKTSEFSLPSGDRLDVLFQVGSEWIAVEVKSVISDEADIVRGMFQCVKYRAVIEAYQATEYLPQSVRTVLVLEGSFPTELDNMRHMLNVEIIDCVKPQ
jgi:hypothetical protein